MIVSTFEIKKIKRNSHQTHRDIMSMFGCKREDNNVLFMQIDDKLIVQSDCPPKSINKALILIIPAFLVTSSSIKSLFISASSVLLLYCLS